IALYSLLSFCITFVFVMIPLDCAPKAQEKSEQVNLWWYFFVNQLWFSCFNALGLLFCFYGAIPVLSPFHLILLWISEQVACALCGVVFYRYSALQTDYTIVRRYSVWTCFILTITYFGIQSKRLHSKYILFRATHGERSDQSEDSIISIRTHDKYRFDYDANNHSNKSIDNNSNNNNNDNNSSLQHSDNTASFVTAQLMRQQLYSHPKRYENSDSMRPMIIHPSKSHHDSIHSGHLPKASTSTEQSSSLESKTNMTPKLSTGAVAHYKMIENTEDTDAMDIFTNKAPLLSVEYMCAIGPGYLDADDSLYIGRDILSANSQDSPDYNANLKEELFGRMVPRLTMESLQNSSKYKEHNDQKGAEYVCLYRSPLVQYGYCLLFSTGVVCTFEFCQWYTSQYFGQTMNKNDSDYAMRHILAFFIFVISFLVLKSLLKTVGFLIDMGKRGGSVFYYQGEMICMVYYYVFYRLIFTTVDSVYLFIGLKVIHLSNEWIMYAFRSSKWYILFLNNLFATDRSKNDDNSSTWCFCRYMFLPEFAQRIFFDSYTLHVHHSLSQNHPNKGNYSENAEHPSLLHEHAYKNWVSFLCLDFGLRLVIMSSTLIGFVIAFALVRFGYNHHVYHFFGDVTMSHFYRVMVVLTASFVVEIINAVIMELFWWRYHLKKSVIVRVYYLLRNFHFRLFFIVIMGAIACDIIVLLNNFVCFNLFFFLLKLYLFQFCLFEKKYNILQGGTFVSKLTNLMTLVPLIGQLLRVNNTALLSRLNRVKFS
ncbi:transcription factor E2F/dimerization partner family protein, partial [Reticulomyxa filosa]